MRNGQTLHKWDIQIANKHTDKVLNALIIGEIKIKWYYTYTLECLKSRRLTIPTIGEDMGLLGPSYSAAGSITW